MAFLRHKPRETIIILFSLWRHGLSLTTTPIGPARKYKKNKGESTVSEELSFFICTQEGRPVCLGYSWAAHGFCCGEKPKHIKQMYPHFWKRAWGTKSDNFFNCSELFNPPLRRDERIHFLFKSLRCQIEHIEFLVKLGWVWTHIEYLVC